MSLRNLFLIFLFLFFSTVLVSCQKDEEVTTSTVVEKDPLPEITADRLQVWFKVAPQIGSYIRKFALEGESVNDKRDLLMLAHSSARTQMAYSEIFKSNSMPTREFWNIIDEIERVKKYTLLKHEEEIQNRRIDILVEAGLEELEAVRRKAASKISEEKKARLNVSIKEMQAKIDELRDLRGDLTPESVGIDKGVMALANANMDQYDKVYNAIWKRDGEARIKKMIDKKVNN